MNDITAEMLRRIKELDPFVGPMDPFCRVTAVLLESKIPTNYLGFEHLRRAILISCEDPDGVLLDGIYLRLEQYYNKKLSTQAIEQAMRSAISVAWENKIEDDWILCFSRDTDGNIKKPKSTEFISRVVKFMELWQGYRQKEGSEIGK